MNIEIKRITEDGYTLTHSWYVDDFGLKRNSFDLFHEETKTHYPFIGNFRVSNFEENAPIEGDDTSPYSDEEYLAVLREQISKITHNQND